MDKQAVIEGTRRWIASMVIGLDLCPFARGVFETERIRYVVTEAADETQLLADLEAELRTLTATSDKGIETTLLIHPLVLGDFRDYNEFLDVADQLLSQLRLCGIIQIASFHPDYQFAGIAADDVENNTNRSLYPMLHLLRESSVAAVANGAIDLADIPRRNIETLKQLGKEKIAAMRAALESGAQS
jgi:uncharacterized protein